MSASHKENLMMEAHFELVQKTVMELEKAACFVVVQMVDLVAPWLVMRQQMGHQSLAIVVDAGKMIQMIVFLLAAVLQLEVAVVYYP